MTTAELLHLQLTDPFRIGLLLALIYVMMRNRAATGIWLPLAAGIVFVAAILPINGLGGAASEPFVRVLSVGLLSNAVLVGAMLALWRLYAALQKPRT